MTSSPSTLQADQNNTSTNTGSAQRPRRARVALACQRCKKRKQKCDGQTPSCSNCSSFNALCKYVKPRPISRSRDPYLKAAEARVAELEGFLKAQGIADNGRDRWRQIQGKLASREEHQESSEIHISSPLQQIQNDTNYTDTIGTIRRPSKRPCLENEPNEVEVEWGGEVRRREINAVVDILRDLSLEASGGYIGASSSITMSRMVGSLVKSKIDGPMLRGEEHLSPKSLSDGSLEEEGQIELGNVPPDIADKLLKGYLKHISTRWPILHSTYLRGLHARRDALGNSYEKSVLHLVYASGGRFLETTGETGAFFPDRHHSAGMKYLDELLQYHDIRSVQILILLAIYSLRAPKGPGAWTYIGLAMRSCIDLGLHRRTLAKRYPLLEVEIRKRIFWTCYSLDRQISIILGRPFAISDKDIDAELPLDVNESVLDFTTLEAALALSNTTPPNQAPVVSTSLSCFIHICRLRKIESQIQQSIYRVDEKIGISETEVDSFIQQLEEWKENIPRDARQHNADKPSTKTDTMVIDGYGYYMVYYYKCMRFLLHPLLSTQDTNVRFLKKCAEACGDVCQTYKKLHQSIPVGFSLMALHSVFLAGLTLVYCTWISPQEVFSIKTSNDMNACSIVLYIITERWPGAKKYRDTYEAIKQSLLESVEESEYEPRRAIRTLNPDLLPSMTRNDEGSAELSRMVADMAGEPMQADDDIFSGLSPAGMPGELTPNMNGMDINFSIPMDFQQQGPLDERMFAFDNFDAINAFQTPGFDLNQANF
ncbi:fungal-specific transcription factor domain-containing protein [Halenospora varia]|nr:fungal-specific transcription factor domain-containing protein [Halenospora varia]